MNDVSAEYSIQAFLLIIVVFLLVASYSIGFTMGVKSTEPHCDPGSIKACADRPGGVKYNQVCLADGKSYSECVTGL